MLKETIQHTHEIHHDGKFKLKWKKHLNAVRYKLWLKKEIPKPEWIIYKVFEGNNVTEAIVPAGKNVLYLIEAELGNDTPDEGNNKLRKGCIIAGTVAGGLAAGVGLVAAAPLALTAAGFTSAGIAAGSWAASMMAAGGGATAAGGAVATLQSVGVLGLGATGSAVVGSVGATIGAAATGFTSYFTTKAKRNNVK